MGRLGKEEVFGQEICFVHALFEMVVKHPDGGGKKNSSKNENRAQILHSF